MKTCKKCDEMKEVEHEEPLWIHMVLVMVVVIALLLCGYDAKSSNVYSSTNNMLIGMIPIEYMILVIIGYYLFTEVISTLKKQGTKLRK